MLPARQGLELPEVAEGEREGEARAWQQWAFSSRALSSEFSTRKGAPSVLRASILSGSETDRFLDTEPNPDCPGSPPTP